MGVAGQVTRWLLVDHARKRHAAKRAGSLVTLDEGFGNQCSRAAQSAEILAVDEVLGENARGHPYHFLSLSRHTRSDACGLDRSSGAIIEKAL